MKSLIEARQKRSHAVRCAAEGMSYDQIAATVGYAHRGSAHRAVHRALDEHEAEGVRDLRTLESARLDRLLQALWPAIETGDISAIATALRITETRIKLHGLNHSRTTDDEDRAYLVVGERSTYDATTQTFVSLGGRGGPLRSR